MLKPSRRVFNHHHRKKNSMIVICIGHSSEICKLQMKISILILVLKEMVRLNQKSYNLKTGKVLIVTCMGKKVRLMFFYLMFSFEDSVFNLSN